MIEMNLNRAFITICVALIPIWSPAASLAGKPLDLHVFQKTTKMGARYGYIDHEGRIVIPAQFERAGPFHDGRASVQIAERWGSIDEKGNLVVAAKYEHPLRFSEGVAVAKFFRNGRPYFEYIDEYGKPIFPARLGVEADDFSDGLALVNSVGGFIDKKGNVTVPWSKSWEDWTAFTNHLAPVQIKGKWGFINNRGRLVVPARFDPAITYILRGVDVGSGDGMDPIVFSEKLAAVKIGGKAGFIDWTGNFVIEPHFSAALPFSEGLALVALNRKWGYIDRSGKIVIAVQFDDASGFHEGLAAVMMSGRWGYIDRNGIVVIKPVFVGAGEFHEGLADAVLNDKSEVYINKQGAKVFDLPTFK